MSIKSFRQFLNEASRLSNKDFQDIVSLPTATKVKKYNKYISRYVIGKFMPKLLKDLYGSLDAGVKAEIIRHAEKKAKSTNSRGFSNFEELDVEFSFRAQLGDNDPRLQGVDNRTTIFFDNEWGDVGSLLYAAKPHDYDRYDMIEPRIAKLIKRL